MEWYGWIEIFFQQLLATGEDFSVEPAESRSPFRALLDVGLVRTTTGNGVFGALKGALDGGLDIPHSDKRFAGFSKDGKHLDPEVNEYLHPCTIVICQLLFVCHHAIATDASEAGCITNTCYTYCSSNSDSGVCSLDTRLVFIVLFARPLPVKL
ncbi:hypothetical protein Ancab_012396 [Ancistrocladus abbreviatus]